LRWDGPSRAAWEGETRERKSQISELLPTYWDKPSILHDVTQVFCVDEDPRSKSMNLEHTALNGARPKKPSI
jgi:hypothetical protein